MKTPIPRMKAMVNRDRIPIHVPNNSSRMGMISLRTGDAVQKRLPTPTNRTHGSMATSNLPSNDESASVSMSMRQSEALKNQSLLMSTSTPASTARPKESSSLSDVPANAPVAFSLKNVV